MLKHIVMRINGLIMALFTLRLALAVKLLWNNVKHWLVSFIHLFLSAVNQLSLLAKRLLNIKVLLANLTIVVQSIKPALKPVVTISGQIGSQLLTIAHRIRRRAKPQRKKGN